MKNPHILIVDFGSQLSKVIVRALQELGHRSALLSPKKAEAYLKENRVEAIILSGGDRSVNEKGAPTISKKVFSMGIPILGICYGHQLIAKILGGKVGQTSAGANYGPTQVSIRGRFSFFDNLPGQNKVWASHRESVTEIPLGFDLTACYSKTGTIAAIENRDKQIWGVQFHPESPETDSGKLMLQNFVQKIAGCEKDWQPRNMIEELQEELRDSTKGEPTLIALSGGVDSTTLCSLAAPVLGQSLKVVCQDGGQLRHNEPLEIRRNARVAGVRVFIQNRKAEFAALWEFQIKKKSLYSAEIKRLLFQGEYEKGLGAEAKRFGSRILAQGSLEPDFIETTGAGSHIKSHHNIGVTVPGCKSIHPFRHLFKHEVRSLAKELGLPEAVVSRQPFPGPGLFIRIIGMWPTTRHLQTVRLADHIVTEILRRRGLYDGISQLVVGLGGVLTTGVKGDEGVYNYPIIVRAVKTVDYMTAEGIELPPEARQEITSALTARGHICRVWFDETPKPPGTVEEE